MDSLSLCHHLYHPSFLSPIVNIFGILFTPGELFNQMENLTW